MVELAFGENWLPFWNECHMLLRDHDRLASFGVWFPGDAVHGSGVSGLDGDHPLVQEQGSICIAHCSCGPLSVSPSSFGKHKPCSWQVVNLRVARVGVAAFLHWSRLAMVGPCALGRTLDASICSISCLLQGLSVVGMVGARPTFATPPACTIVYIALACVLGENLACHCKRLFRRRCILSEHV